MKTNSNFKELKGNIIHFLRIIIILLTTLQGVQGQEKKMYNHDFLMPKIGESMVEFYSGLPYVAVGVYSYGFSKRFSAGIFYGYTPFEKGYGLRMKAIIAQPSESFRINVKSPFIYYPGMKKENGKPWVLAWPAVNGEWKLKNGSRIWTGVGLIGAARVDFLLGDDNDNDPPGDPCSWCPVDPTPGDPTPVDPTYGVDMSSLFNTFQFGYSKPLSNHWSFVAEVAPVMEGFKLKSPNGFLDTAPVVLTIGISGSF